MKNIFKKITELLFKRNKGQLYAVYGTLRTGFPNFYHLNNEHCKSLGVTKTDSKFKMVTLGSFPGVIPGGNQQVTIEVFRVMSEEVERDLDRLEGYPRFYQKMTIPTSFGFASMYILSEEKYGNCPVIESGDWEQWCDHLNDYDDDEDQEEYDHDREEQDDEESYR